MTAACNLCACAVRRFGVIMADDGPDVKNQKKTVKHDSGAADLERVTDYAEEKEISSDITGVSNHYFPASLSSVRFAIYFYRYYKRTYV